MTGFKPLVSEATYLSTDPQTRPLCQPSHNHCRSNDSRPFKLIKKLTLESRFSQTSPNVQFQMVDVVTSNVGREQTIFTNSKAALEINIDRNRFNVMTLVQ